eukprot:2702746-Pleurochrysis_carterae.AAC.1
MHAHLIITEETLCFAVQLCIKKHVKPSRGSTAAQMHSPASDYSSHYGVLPARAVAEYSDRKKSVHALLYGNVYHMLESCFATMSKCFSLQSALLSARQASRRSIVVQTAQTSSTEMTSTTWCYDFGGRFVYPGVCKI